MFFSKTNTYMLSFNKTSQEVGFISNTYYTFKNNLKII